MHDLICVRYSPHMLILEIGTIINIDPSKDTKSKYDMDLQERYDLTTYCRDQWNHLNPLGEILNGSDNEFMIIK